VRHHSASLRKIAINLSSSQTLRNELTLTTGASRSMASHHLEVRSFKKFKWFRYGDDDETERIAKILDRFERLRIAKAEGRELLNDWFDEEPAVNGYARENNTLVNGVPQTVIPVLTCITNYPNPVPTGPKAGRNAPPGAPTGPRCQSSYDAGVRSDPFASRYDSAAEYSGQNQHAGYVQSHSTSFHTGIAIPNLPIRPPTGPANPSQTTANNSTASWPAGQQRLPEGIQFTPINPTLTSNNPSSQPRGGLPKKPPPRKPKNKKNKPAKPEPPGQTSAKWRSDAQKARRKESRASKKQAAKSAQAQQHAQASTSGPHPQPQQPPTSNLPQQPKPKSNPPQKQKQNPKQEPQSTKRTRRRDRQKQRLASLPDGPGSGSLGPTDGLTATQRRNQRRKQAAKSNAAEGNSGSGSAA
jgi:hypothetical protein